MWSRPSAGKKAKDVGYLLSNYWGRLLSTCGCWFFWDFGFYGNKVFQSEFIAILSPVRKPACPSIFASLRLLDTAEDRSAQLVSYPCFRPKVICMPAQTCHRKHSSLWILCASPDRLRASASMYHKCNPSPCTDGWHHHHLGVDAAQLRSCAHRLLLFCSVGGQHLLGPRPHTANWLHNGAQFHDSAV